MDQYKELLAVRSLVGVPPGKALHHIGLLIDTSNEGPHPEGLRRAIALATELASAALSAGNAATLEYFVGNAWAGLRHAAAGSGNTTTWESQLEEFSKEITHFRLAVRSEGFDRLPAPRRCQIVTNLANAMSEIGRPIEAVEYFDRALKAVSSFGMARGNRGRVLVRYARALYDPGHTIVILQRALEDLRASIAGGDLEPRAREVFERRSAWIDEVLTMNKAKTINLESHSLGRSKAERAYRQWCLEKRLFVNPLNDLGVLPIAARDVLTSPSITAGIDERPYAHGFFNQLKQEFVSARYLYYEGIAARRAHFSDRDVLLYNTLDYPVYSFAIERVKLAFRVAYGLFDKVAFFLNSYLKLGIPEKAVNFRTIWYNSGERKKGLRVQIATSGNWPLHGIFALSQDLYDPAPGFRDALEPDAYQLADVRNHLEHKYLKVHDVAVRADPMDSFADGLAYSVGRGDFESKGLRLLSMARSALIYLSLAIHDEEARRRRTKGATRAMPMPLDKWEDEWKR